ncbi:hypothetical protein [Corallococcus sp. AS-1-6]|uniref:hypothetical protein n=1 Tax=Corallococcus sp. AS-1-6 TaxID=2874599 RepID=UPI001CBAD71B|nr:hypothetical protein [Corallococcus sp. AS-1-6]MBZ4376484.1 hypothetical protein [Corallococcus sp. AS-1-6]
MTITAKDQTALEKYVGHGESLCLDQVKSMLVVRGCDVNRQMWMNSGVPQGLVGALGSMPTKQLKGRGYERAMMSYGTNKSMIGY